MKITLKDGSIKEYAEAMSAYDIARDISEGLARAACAVEINGEVKDLRTVVDSDCEMNILTAKDSEGLRTVRHTCSHVLAEAVKRLFPNVKLAIGPSIDEGFYYDFESEPFSREDLDNLEKEMKKWKKGIDKPKVKITEDDVCEVVSGWTKIPVSKLSETEIEKLKNLDKSLKERVIGQDQAVDTISKAIKRARVGLSNEKRPIGSFIFVGPTGVGKTELAKSLARSLFGDENSLIRFDMSEYMESHSVSKLIGAPPGYVGFDEGGQLTEQVRRKPYSIVLFDEIEKAHYDVFNMLLQILEDGRLTDSNGQVIDFKNTVIIMTSNAGAKDSSINHLIGFGNKEATDYEKSKKTIIDELKKIFRPEFLNRVDEIIVFNKLKREDIENIAKIMLDEVKKRLEKNKINVVFDKSIIEYICKVGYDENYGARPLRRCIQTKIEDRFADEILNGNLKNGDNIKVIEKNENVMFGKM